MYFQFLVKFQAFYYKRMPTALSAKFYVLYNFYRAMHYVHSAVLRSHVVRPSVRPSVRL